MPRDQGLAKGVLKLHQEEVLDNFVQPQHDIDNFGNDCSDVAADPLQDNIESDVDEELGLPDVNNTTVVEQMKRQAAVFIGSMLSEKKYHPCLYSENSDYRSRLD
ncbi:hypothetical protein HOLleu_10480 [Holothuria leucospilota]|uniref:Uncharacterized protein n=1 Tax=Holothuria leucospilota TaxID=206669 RepID=A0A9Q1HFR4_HOLLE|nr:hypothetical protein HOLleu_10480 [Holothuria leucospilota]